MTVAASEFPDHTRFRTLAWDIDAGTELGVRRALRRLRTVYWFEGLRQDANAPTAYALGRRLQPETYRKKQKPEAQKKRKREAESEVTEANHNNLWAKYQVGTHAPKLALRRRVDALFRGSAARFVDPFFDAIDPRREMCHRGDALLRSLHPDVVRAVFDNRGLDEGVHRRRKSLPQTLNLLETLTTLDALTALTVLLREGHERNDAERVLTIQPRLYFSFLVVCATSTWYEASAALALILDRWIFRRTAQAEWCWVIDPADFRRSIRLLRFATAKFPARRVPRNAGRRLAYYARGLFGLDYKNAFSPARALTVAPEVASFDAVVAVVEHQALLEWAWQSLLLGDGKAGAMELRARLAEWKSDPILLRHMARTVDSSVRGGWSGSL